MFRADFSWSLSAIKQETCSLAERRQQGKGSLLRGKGIRAFLTRNGHKVSPQSRIFNPIFYQFITSPHQLKTNKKSTLCFVCAFISSSGTTMHPGTQFQALLDFCCTSPPTSNPTPNWVDLPLYHLSKLPVLHHLSFLLDNPKDPSRPAKPLTQMPFPSASIPSLPHPGSMQHHYNHSHTNLNCCPPVVTWQRPSPG